MKLRDDTLGTREERRSTLRTRFEKCEKRAVRVGKGRCFGVGLNHQKPRNLNGPAVGGKVRGKLSEEEEEHVRLRENLVKVTFLKFLCKPHLKLLNIFRHPSMLQ